MPLHPTSSNTLPPVFPLLPPIFVPHKKSMFDLTNNLSKQKHAHFPDFLGQRIAESYDVLNLGVVRTQRTVQSYGNCRSWNGREGQFVDVENESGVRTPPLWPGSPPRRPNLYSCLSPASKAQAIERGQRELMELVSKMPESCYELSLKDLVEQPMMEVKQETTAVDKDGCRRKKEGKKKKNEKKAQISRSRSVDNGGFLLKMVFPVSLGSKKKKKKDDSNSTSNYNSKASPRPSPSDASAKVEDKEWWKKRFSGSTESESCGSSINSRSTKSSRSSSCSSSTSTDSRRHGMGSCCSFIRTRKSDTSE